MATSQPTFRVVFRHTVEATLVQTLAAADEGEAYRLACERIPALWVEDFHPCPDHGGGIMVTSVARQWRGERDPASPKKTTGS